ncbi:CCA tRNA nucleotidyltransferase [Anaerovorax odorimutans]|uniref:CCA tRNA nucleotidyltransferase n=1 Tax=Anaerovorax odorimutans TaxID=109327 RepID=UPI00041B258A|nr:CCA tRNA nucleotidyltransferase [Anaerovorax odorimutans]
MRKIKIPKSVKNVLNILEDNGFEAYIVGGCVRDSIVGRTPKDWDICTSARPMQYLKCFENFHIIQTGLKHGTVTVVSDNEFVEVTSFRADGTYSDKRRPDNVIYITSLEDDLKRRDFTMNALSYNEKDGLQDYFSGLKDIEKKQIKCVGDPEKRFAEDALRILRALRFCAELGFDIENETLEAAKMHAEKLKNISVERIYNEFAQMICGKYCKKALILGENIIEEFIPEINILMKNCKWNETLDVLDLSSNNKVLRLAIFFCKFDIKDRIEIAYKVLKRLKCDKQTMETVVTLIKSFNEEIYSNRISVKRWLNKLGETNFKLLLEFHLADVNTEIKNEEKRKNSEDIKQALLILDDIINSGECYSLRDLNVDGNDLIKIGVPYGKMIGSILQNLLEMVINEDLKNDKEILLNQVNIWLKSNYKLFEKIC